VALVLAGLLAVASAQARAPVLTKARAALCQNGFESDWKVTASKFKMVRTGVWKDGGSQATATETDTMSFIKHPQFAASAVTADESCSPWELRFNSFIRPGVADLRGQWTGISGSGSPTQGACKVHKVLTTAHDDPFTVQLVPPSGHGFGVFFKNRARHVKLVVNVGLSLLLGQTCKTPFGDGHFDFPQNSANSTVITLSTRMLERDRSFTIRFSGSGSHTEPWFSPMHQGASEHFDANWSGMFRFQATGCQEFVFLAGKVFRRCAPA
jgi:hypothetical protein